MDAMMHMHIDNHRKIFILQKTKKPLCNVNCTPNSIKIGSCNQRIEVSYIKIFIQVNSVVEALIPCGVNKIISILKFINLIFRKIHIQFYKV